MLFRSEFELMSSANKHRKSCQSDKQRSSQYHVEYRNSILGKHGREEELDATSRESSVSPDLAAPSPLQDDLDTFSVDDDLDQSIATRRRRRPRNLPLRFRDGAPDRARPVRVHKDILPQDLASLPPPSVVSAPTRSSPSSDETTSDSSQTTSMESSKNSFGLFRRYFGSTFPSHDPDAGFTATLSQDTNRHADSLASAPHPATPVHQRDNSKLYDPYPNATSFALESWQNNGNTTKSKGGFRKLIKLVESGVVKPHELRGVNWDEIDTHLARKPDSGSTDSTSP